MNHLEMIYNAAEGAPGRYVQNYFARVGQIMGAIDAAAMDRMIQTLEQTSAAGGTIFLIANGGSSAVCAHMVNDMVVGGMIEGQYPLRALSLTDNGPSVTALGNDAGFDNIFAHQIRMMMRPGDALIAMSCSGNSENILRGVAAAREMGCTTIGWAGFDGGRLAKACDIVIPIPATCDEYGPVEDMFSILGHVTVTWLIMRRGKMLHH